MGTGAVMGGPWEKFADQSEPAQSNKPWEKFAAPAQDQPSTLSNIIRGQVEALPMYGSVAGGLIGGALATPADLVAGPVPTALGAMGGAGIGAGLGKGLKNLINKHVYGEDPYKNSTMGDVAKDYAGEVALGAAGEGIGQVAGRGLLGLSKMLPEQAAHAPQIMQAASRMGVEASPGMVTSSPFLKGLESDLAKSPTIGGALTRRVTQPTKDSIETVTKGALDDASAVSDYVAGSQMKKGLISDIGQRYQPIQMAYDDAGAATKDIPLNPQSQSRVAKNIRNIKGTNILPELRTEAETYASGIENAKSADEIQILKSKAKASLRDPGTSFEQKQIAKEALDKMDRFEHNSIMREAIAQARTPGEGSKIGKDIVGNLKSAAKEYRLMKGDLGTLARGSKVTSGKYGVSNVLKEIDQVPAEKLPDMMFKQNDHEFMNFLKDQHPDVYAAAKKQKLAEILDKSKSPQDGSISPRKFLQAIKDLGPEARQHLFGERINSLEDIQTLVHSLPADVNPSGTATALSFKQTLNPMEQGADLGRYGLYKALSNAPNGLKPLLETVGRPGAPSPISQGLIQGIRGNK